MRVPVCEGSPDNMLGVIQVREVLAPLLEGGTIDVRRPLWSAPVVPDTPDTLGWSFEVVDIDSGGWTKCWREGSSSPGLDERCQATDGGFGGVSSR